VNWLALILGLGMAVGQDAPTQGSGPGTVSSASPAEAEDVPAVWEETDYCFKSYQGCYMVHEDGSFVSLEEYFSDPRPIHYYRWTCNDPTRILEHDEQDPPRWWCRKVKP